jgi:hypothetical protein
MLLQFWVAGGARGAWNNREHATNESLHRSFNRHEEND